MYLLILESLGSTELIFILVMALVFFGPRKLPQLSRTVGKSLADFRRASEDFKRTWDKEVTLEETGTSSSTAPFLLQNEIAAATDPGPSIQSPIIEAIKPERVIARDTSVAPDTPSDQNDFDEPVNEPPHSPKTEWL